MVSTRLSHRDERIERIERIERVCSLYVCIMGVRQRNLRLSRAQALYRSRYLPSLFLLCDNVHLSGCTQYGRQPSDSRASATLAMLLSSSLGRTHNGQYIAHIVPWKGRERTPPTARESRTGIKLRTFGAILLCYVLRTCNHYYIQLFRCTGRHTLFTLV